MLQEALDYFFHSFVTPKYLSKLGLIQEVVGIKYRHKRHKDQWLEHQENTRAEILKQVKGLKKKRKALVIGAGLLLDVPLKELAAEFEEVVLTDIFFMQEAINEIKLHDNCHFVECDITSVLKEAYYLWLNTNKDKHNYNIKLRNLIHKKPTEFLMEEKLDYVVSCNLLSQLPMAFEGFAEKHKLHDLENYELFTNSICANHIEYLKSFNHKTHVHLITDVEKQVYDTKGTLMQAEASNGSQDFSGFSESNSWQWLLADLGELHKNFSLRLAVKSFTRDQT